MVDGYFDTVTMFDDYYDAISEGLFNEEPMELRDQRQWFQMRQALIKFHRLAVPMREAVNGLMRREQSLHRRRDLPVLPGRLRPRHCGSTKRPTRCAT